MSILVKLSHLMHLLHQKEQAKNIAAVGTGMLTQGQAGRAGCIAVLCFLGISGSQRSWSMIYSCPEEMSVRTRELVFLKIL